ncbi:MAG: L-lysine 6-transaminase [Bacteroidia bacterium]|nr:L-lysine 6-transaminase [Bacteroidia bacterium]
MSYQLAVAPDQVASVLKRRILKDGYDMVMDLDKSHGVYVYDSAHQRELLDFFTCFATIPIGYNHPKMLGDEAFKASLLKAALINPSNSDIYTQQYAQFLETFERVAIPSYMRYAFFIAGGALAVENCLKAAMDWKVQKNFAKGYTREVGHKVLHFKDAFHGRSGYTMSLTNTDPAKTKWFARFTDWPRVDNPYIVHPFSDTNYDDLLRREQLAINQIKQAFREHTDQICAIIVEPIQSEGGDHHFRKEFFEQLRQLCDENEALLIYDEVQTGVAVSGRFWCHEHFGENARPDLIAFAKKMQICGVLAGPKLDEVETNVFRVSSRINSTWGGNLVDMVRADKILQIIEEDGLVAHADRTGDYLLTQLHDVARSHPKLMANVRGRGLLCAFDLPTPAQRNALIAKGMEHNVLFLGCGQRTIRFRPGLVIQPADIDKGMGVLASVLHEMGAA